MRQRRRYRQRKYLTADAIAAIWTGWRAGQTTVAMGTALGHPPATVQQLLSRHGGIAPRPRCRASRALSSTEREEISRGLAAGESARAIAQRLGRAPSTISREIARHGGAICYRAAEADAAAWQAAKRPKRCRLATDARLCAVVAAKLAADWAPQQIAAWLVSEYPDDPAMRVSHETIYRTLYVQARGALKKELTAHLRRRRTMRRSRAATTRGHGQGTLDRYRFDQPAAGQCRGPRRARALGRRSPRRDEDVAHRHAGGAAVALSSSWCDCRAHDTATVVHALTRRVQRLPASLKQSLTWDRGKEMALHKQFTVATDVQVYFCDPRSPWQRGSNENTNGLLRQYFPKGQDISHLTQRQLDAVALKLNTRPRQTLAWKTPAQVLAAAVASTG